jgi:hypothetical protein
VNELEHGVFDNINDNLKYVHDMNWHSISYRESPDVLVAISWFYQVHTFFNKGVFSVYYCIVNWSDNYHVDFLSGSMYHGSPLLLSVLGPLSNR